MQNYTETGNINSYLKLLFHFFIIILTAVSKANLRGH